MVDRAQTPLDLSWGRTINGCFVINVVIAAADPGSQTNGHKAMTLVPVASFALTAEEEAKLLQSLTGLSIVKEIPDGRV